MTLLHCHEAKLRAIARLVHVNRGAVVVSFSSGELSGLVHRLVKAKDLHVPYLHEQSCL